MSTNGAPLKELGESICPYCGVGCRLRVDGVAGTPLRVRGVQDAPANLGRICAKGHRRASHNLNGFTAPDRTLESLARPHLADKVGVAGRIQQVDAHVAADDVQAVRVLFLHEFTFTVAAPKYHLPRPQFAVVETNTRRQLHAQEVLAELFGQRML